MKIRRCDKCEKYVLEETCSCNSKTREASYKYKKPKHAKLIFETVKKNVDKKRNREKRT